MHEDEIHGSHEWNDCAPFFRTCYCPGPVGWRPSLIVETPHKLRGIMLTMSATGGAWFPVSFMPEFMQTIAKFTLVYWSMEGFSQVLWAGQSFIQILPTVGILLGIAAAVMTVAVWRFNRGKLFD